MKRLVGAVIIVAISASAWWLVMLQPQGGQLIKRMLGEREYLLYVPSALQNPTPAILVFHGGGGPWGSAELMSERSGWRELADREGILVVFGQGTVERPGEPVRLEDNEQGRNIRSWSDGSEKTPASRQGIDDLAYVQDILADLARDYPVDERRIYATGFSNGATFTYYLSTHMPKRFAAIAPFAGLLYEELPEVPPSLFVVSGSGDSVPESAKSSALQPDPLSEWFRALGCDGSVPPGSFSHACAKGDVVRLIVPNLGHEYDVRVVPAIWDFFREHSR